MTRSFSHRIMTEDINRENILAIADKHFDCYTWTAHNGRYKGKHEASLTIEVIGGSYADALRVAEEIKVANHQDSVLIFSVNGKSTSI